MKKFHILLGLLFVVALTPLGVNASNICVGDVIKVNQLPTASEDTMNKTYYYNKEFYNTKKVIPNSELKVGDNLKDKALCFNWDIDFFSNFHDTIPSGGKGYNLFNDDYSSRFTFYKNTDMSKISFSFNRIEFFSYDFLTSTIIKNISPRIYSNDFIIETNDNYLLFKDYFGYCSNTYSYEYVTCDYNFIEVEKDKELILFFDSFDIKNMEMFSKIDFMLLTDFQLIVLVFAVNILFGLSIIFIIYLSLKVISYTWRVIKCLL